MVVPSLSRPHREVMHFYCLILATEEGRWLRLLHMPLVSRFVQGLLSSFSSFCLFMFFFCPAFLFPFCLDSTLPSPFLPLPPFLLSYFLPSLLFSLLTYLFYALILPHLPLLRSFPHTNFSTLTHTPYFSSFSWYRYNEANSKAKRTSDSRLKPLHLSPVFKESL